MVEHAANPCALPARNGRFAAVPASNAATDRPRFAFLSSLQALSNTDVSGGYPAGDKVVIPKVSALQNSLS